MTKWLAAFVFVLGLSVPLEANAVTSDGACAGEADDEACALADWASLSDPQKSAVSAYKDAIDTYPAVVTVMSYQDLKEVYRQSIWDRAYEAELNNGVLDIPNHPGMAEDVYLDELPYVDDIELNEFHTSEYFGAKVAHALWLHVNSKLPWDLSDIDAADLTYLFDPNQVFSTPRGEDGFDPDGFPVAEFTLFVDHSPKRIYDVAVTAIGGLPFSGTARDALELLVANIGTDFRHSHGGDALHAVTIDQSLVDHVSRKGCQFASRLMEGLAQSLNIPARHLYGWYLGSGHQGSAFPSVDKFLAHGDTIYSAVSSFPARNTFESWEWAEANLTQFDPDNDLKNRRVNFILRQWWSAHRYWLYEQAFCAYGWDYFTESGNFVIDSPQDDHWFLPDGLQNELITRTGCDP
jgi:hypothetical protein